MGGWGGGGHSTVILLCTEPLLRTARTAQPLHFTWIAQGESIAITLSPLPPGEGDQREHEEGLWV